MGHASAISNSTMAVAPSASFKNVTSPIPYLFGGLALMLALIGLALLILACSYSKSSSSTSNEEKTTKRMEVDSEPKIVVIMAGDSNPTYLAKPVPSTNHTQEEAD
ncbi:Protein GLUTAMINE DUMPER 2, partial [Mucuna pruriens]